MEKTGVKLLKVTIPRHCGFYSNSRVEAGLGKYGR